MIAPVPAEDVRGNTFEVCLVNYPPRTPGPLRSLLEEGEAFVEMAMSMARLLSSKTTRGGMPSAGGADEDVRLMSFLSSANFEWCSMACWDAEFMVLNSVGGCQ